MDLRLGKPLPYQQSNPPQSRHMALRLKNTSLQKVFPMEFYPQVSEAILRHMVD